MSTEWMAILIVIIAAGVGAFALYCLLVSSFDEAFKDEDQQV